MGSGKSSWAIRYINNNREKKFLCIVPLLEECERYKQNTEIDIIDPKQWGTKWKHFQYLVENGRSIVTTHALIQKMDLEVLELLKSRDYVLMIDECLEVLTPYKISKNDVKIIFNEKLVTIDEDGFLVWNDDHKLYTGAFDEIKKLCGLKSLMGYKRENSDDLAKILMWNFPIDFFKCFAESYIFTYLWDGSIQKAYFDLHGIQYKKYMIKDRQLSDYSNDLARERKRNISGLIHIYEGKLNRIGDKIGKSNPLSKTWYENKKKKNSTILNQLKRNTENYFRSITKTDSSQNMYTTFSQYTKYVKGKGYSKGLVSCNARGTNEYRDKTALAYLVNFFMHPEVRHFINYYKLDFNEDLYSLSALLQWIWRSQIRDNKPVSIYIPSERMRELLKVWLFDEKNIA